MIGLFKISRLTPQDKVLIQAAAGGVGTAAVQMCNAFGCEVYGTAGSDKKVEFLESLGIDMGVNYRKDDFYQLIAQKAGGIDRIIETVGGNVFKKSLELLNPFGQLLVLGYASIPLNKANPFSYWKTWQQAPKAKIMQMAKKSVAIGAAHIGYLIDKPEIVRSSFQELRDFMVTHHIKPVIGKTFDFTQIPDAHAYMESRESIGKIVINVNDC